MSDRFPTRAEALIHLLDLAPHPEGGHYRETFRSPEHVVTPRGLRAASTAIWFLLTAGQVSRWHRVLADETWHWYEGGPLELLVCSGPGAPVARHRLGPVDGVQRPQWIVPAGWWQAARPLGEHALVGCTVAPGFDFADFALVESRSLEAEWLRRQADVELVEGPARHP